jgi:hypothetical protein
LSAARQRELELSYREGDFVWVEDRTEGRLLARVRSSQKLTLSTRKQVFLVTVRYPKGWGPSEHREIAGVPTSAELARLRALDAPGAAS